MTDEWNLEVAIKMWNEGSSSSIIAARFGITRNAAIGRLTRARKNGHTVTNKAPFAKPYYKVRLTPKPVKKPELPELKKTPVLKSMPLKQEAPMEYKFIYELNANECKYSTMTNSNGIHLFCGKPTDKTYCTEHHALCNTKPEVKVKKVQWVEYKNKFMRTF